MSNSVDPDETVQMGRLIWIYAICKNLLLSPVAVKVKESVVLFYLLLENSLNFSISLSHISLSNQEQNLRRYLDVYV